MRISIDKETIKQRARLYDCVNEFDPEGRAAVMILLAQGADFTKFEGVLMILDNPNVYYYDFED